MTPGWRRHPLQLALGFSVWSVWFVCAYGGLSIGCSLRPPAPDEGSGTWINLALALWTMAVAAGLTALAAACWRARAPAAADAPPVPQRFIAPVAAVLHLAAAVATLFVGLPLVALPPCV